MSYRALLAALLIAAMLPAAAAAALDGPRLHPRDAASTYLVVRPGVPGRAVALRARPGGPVVARVGPWTALGGRPRLAVVEERGAWLGVTVPELPNGRLGWVRRDRVRIALTRVALVVDLSERTLVLRVRGQAVRRIEVAVGAPESPTPTGRFAVTDRLPGRFWGDYFGCCILVLSGHQPRLPPGWRGGDLLGIHGTDVPATIGAASSAGCLRARDADLRELWRRVPVGAPVFIRA